MIDQMNNRTEDIKAIREMMERSSKFLSLSGMAGVAAGTAAIAGAAFAYFYLLRDPGTTDFTHTQEMLILLSTAFVVLAVALGAGIWLSYRKARRTGRKIFDRTTSRILYAMAVPLVAGGLFCLTLLFSGLLYAVISGTLIFYGLALVAASKYTYGEIHWLGLTEIVLGLLALLFGRYGIVFWTLGFGVCHIVYGLVMHFKYDRAEGR